MTLFRYLDFETISTCNRRCPTCIRNSHPDRQALASWFWPHYLPERVILGALDQAVEMGFKGGVCLSHYNEAMMDERLPYIARRVKSYGLFTFLNSNGDYLTESLAQQLDGVLDRLIVTLYLPEPRRSERAAWMTSLFHQTELQLVTATDTNNGHQPTHFSPAFPVAELARAAQGYGCIEPATRVIINHRRQYLLCCEDVIGNFNLGTFPETSLADHWSRVTEILEGLSKPGGRAWHRYCLSCPRR